MADLYTFRKNVITGSNQPYMVKGRFAAGASTPVERGDILILAGGVWAPISSDTAMAGTIAVAAHRLVSGHLAGLYPIYVPRPGDVWEYPLAADSNPALGGDLYYSSDQAVTTTAGTNILANVCDHPGFVPEQGNVEVGDVLDRGSGATVYSVGRVFMSFVQASSYFAALHG